MVDVYVKKLELIRDETGLTRQEIADVVGATSRTVIRWASGHAAPRGESRDRLLELAVVSQLAGRVMKPSVVSAWLYEPNSLLDFEKPIELIGQGRFREVVAAINAIGEGIYV